MHYIQDLKEKETKGTPLLRWIDNINADLTSLGLTLSNRLDKGPRTKEVIAMSPFHPNGWR